MKELDGEQRERLGKIQQAVAAEEPKLAAAIDEQNAAVRATYEQFLELAAGYERARAGF